MASHSPLLLVLGLALCCGMCTAHRHHDPYYMHELQQTQAELKITRLELSRERALNDLLRHQSSIRSASAPASAPQDAAPKTTSTATPQQQPPAPPQRGCAICGILSSLVTTVAAVGIIRALVCLAAGRCGPSGAPQCVGFSILRFVGIVAGAHLILTALTAISSCFAGLMAIFLLPALATWCCSRSEPQQPASPCSWRPCTWFSCSPARARAVPRGQPLPAVPLARGARGPGVAQLQHCLIELGYMQPSAIRFCAGVYGPRTAEAVDGPPADGPVRPSRPGCAQAPARRRGDRQARCGSSQWPTFRYPANS